MVLDEIQKKIEELDTKTPDELLLMKMGFIKICEETPPKELLHSILTVLQALELLVSLDEKPDMLFSLGRELLFRKDQV